MMKHLINGMIVTTVNMAVSTVLVVYAIRTNSANLFWAVFAASTTFAVFTMCYFMTKAVR